VVVRPYKSDAVDSRPSRVESRRELLRARDMREVKVLSAGIVAAVIFTMSAVQAQSATPTEANGAFMKKVIQDDLAEIQIGKLAEEKGTNKSVRKFGKKLVTDHGENLKKAKSVAHSIGVKPPNAPNATQEATYDNLSNLSGPQFDRQFVERAVQAHRKDIKEFRRQAEKPGPTAAFAGQTLPTLEQHLRIAHSLSRSMAGAVR
jgi:putative membrane protein